MLGRTLRFLTFLAPNMFPVYEFIAHYAGKKLGCPTELLVGDSYEQLGLEADVGFICGLPYVNLMRQREPPIDLLAAPVLRGDRYGGKPVYFSDVIVARNSRFSRSPICAGYHGLITSGILTQVSASSVIIFFG